MNNLKMHREAVNISAHGLVHSLGDPAVMSVRRYNAIERGAMPTGNERKNILALLNVVRREAGKELLQDRDLVCFS